jgi:hypothetical protein
LKILAERVGGECESTRGARSGSSYPFVDNVPAVTNMQGSGLFPDVAPIGVAGAGSRRVASSVVTYTFGGASRDPSVGLSSQILCSWAVRRRSLIILETTV